jgi:hypothetical protein
MTDRLKIAVKEDYFIHTIRDQRVMLDSDLAMLYGVSTKVLNQAVHRNVERFPEDFMFQLTSVETSSLRSQIVTLKKGKRGEHRKYLPYAFTEQGVSMLSSVLRSPQAIQINIAIMRAFVKLREVMTTREGLINRLEIMDKRLASHNGVLEEHAVEIRTLFQAIRQLMEPRKRKPRIGFRA